MHFFGLQHGHRNHYACCHLESEQNWHLLQCRIKCHCIHFEMLQVCLFAAPSSIPDLSTLPSLGCVVASVFLAHSLQSWCQTAYEHILYCSTFANIKSV